MNKSPLLLLLLLTGCSGFLPELPADYRVEEHQENGVIVGSVGTNPLGKQWREWSRYNFHSINDPKFQGHVTSAVNWSNPFYPQPECPDDGLPYECANLFALILPAGLYQFTTVIPAMDSYVAQGWSGWVAELQEYRFEVRSGRATYIGNMLSRLCGGSSYSYYAIATVGIARVAQGDVADRYDRDLPLLREKFPQLENTVIGNETMSGIPWRWEYKQTDKEQLAAHWQSDCAPKREDSLVSSQSE